MHIDLIKLKEQAIANRRGDYYMSSAGADLDVGRVACFVDFEKRNRFKLDKHVCARFELNGKRIAADALGKMLDSAA